MYCFPDDCWFCIFNFLDSQTKIYIISLVCKPFCDLMYKEKFLYLMNYNKRWVHPKTCKRCIKKYIYEFEFPLIYMYDSDSDFDMLN